MEGLGDGRPGPAGVSTNCLKRMQKVLLPVCKIETVVCGLSSGLLLLSGALVCSHRVLAQIRRLLAVVAAAARARVTGTLIKDTEGPPPLPSSPVSQIFVVGGGASELVVLVVVSGEHGGNLGQGQGLGSHPDLGVQEAQYSYILLQAVSAFPIRHSCLLCQTCPTCPIREILLPNAQRCPLCPLTPSQGCPESKDQEHRVRRTDGSLAAI